MQEINLLKDFIASLTTTVLEGTAVQPRHIPVSEFWANYSNHYPTDLQLLDCLDRIPLRGVVEVLGVMVERSAYDCYWIAGKAYSWEGAEARLLDRIN